MPDIGRMALPRACRAGKTSGVDPRAPRTWSGIRRVARAALRIDSAVADVAGVGVVSTVALLLYVVIFVPVGLVVLFAWMAAVFVIGVLLPREFAGFVMLGAFGMGLAILGVVFVKLYRRLPRQVKALASDPASLVADEDDEPDAAVTTRPAASSPRLSLAELDARLAPGAAVRPSEPRASPA